METSTQTPPKPAAQPAATSVKPAEKPAAPFNDAFSELEKLDSLGPNEAYVAPAQEGKKEPAPQAPAKPAAKPPVKVAPKAPAAKEQPASNQPAEPALDNDPSAKFALTPDLRKAYRKLHTDYETTQKELLELRARASGEPDTERQTIVEQNRRLQARLEEKDKELRYLDYTRSDEFKAKFEEPFKAAMDDAYDEIKEFSVTDSEGNSRPATSKDFDRIFDAPPEHVRGIAKDLFGEYASDVLSMRRKLVDLRKNADREAKRYREEAKVRQERQVSDRAQQELAVRQLWESANAEIVKRFPEDFGMVEGDDELNTAFKDSYAYIDRQAQSGMKLEDKIATQAALRHRAAAFKPMKIRLKRATERIAELEAALLEYEQSAPGEGKPSERTGQNANGYESPEDTLNRMAAEE